MPEKIENETLQNIKLKDRVDYLPQENLFSKTIENPVEKLRFRELREQRKNNVWISALVILLISSIALNSSVLKKADYKFFNLFKNLNDFMLAELNSPYVVTIGEYGNVLVAKDEAIKILPQFKQIDIKKLDSGVYTFEMERFSSKKKAYTLANKFIQDGLDGVHVRYLLKK